MSYNVSNFYEWVYTMHEKSLWKVVFEVKRSFISCNDIAFFKMSWYSISPPCCRSDESDLAYISQLIKGFVLPLYPVLYVKVGSSSFYLPCVKYLFHDVIIARPKQGCTKKWNVTVYHFRYISVIIFLINEWHTCRIFVVLNFILFR